MESPKTRFLTDFFLLIVIFSFLLSYFQPQLIFSPTTPTGGDTPSHFTAAVLFREFFLRHFQITGWDYGNLAGYPLFQYYFPLSFILCALFSLLLPLTVSFKITTVLGVFLLPLSAFYFLKKLHFEFPAPILGSALTLPFLFVESQSMWGGNIPSTLAGEFTYALSMAIALVYLAGFYSGVQTGTKLWRNALLLALAGFSHGCALLVAGTMPLFCVFQGSDTCARLKYYVKVNLLAFLWLAFWLVPWLASQDYMSPFNFLWVFRSWSEFFPPVLLPLYGLALISGVHSLYRFFRRVEVDGRSLFLWFGVLICGVFFHIGYQLNVVDIRFIPFLQLFVTLIGVMFLGGVLRKFPGRWTFTIAIVMLAIVWTDYNTVTIRGWIRWNYEGFEKKPLWPLLREATGFLKGTIADPRVVYEHSAQHDQFGSVRTFESLPYLSGRATLEGSYLQSSINSPYIFYLQSEISEVTSCPLPDYHCSSLNFKQALAHLNLFNVSHLIIRSDIAKERIRSFPDFVLEKSLPPLEIYRIADNDGRYVMPLFCKPVLYTGRDWKREAFRWYRNYRLNSVPVVIDSHPATEDRDQFARVTGVFPAGEKCSPQAHRCLVRETIEHDRIRIWTSCIGHPLIIKTSYHPRWEVEGASKVYLATPGFMLVFPQKKDIVLNFGWATSNYLGVALTLTALLLALPNIGFVVVRRRQTHEVAGNAFFALFLKRLFALAPRGSVFSSHYSSAHRWLSAYLTSPRGSRLLKTALAMVATGSVLVVFFAVERNDSNILFEKGLEHYFRQDLDSAQKYFRQAAYNRPESSFGINGRFYWGLCLYRQKRYHEASEVFRSLVERFPETMHAPEALYHVGLSEKAAGLDNYDKYFLQAIRDYPESRWAQYSQERLREANFDLGIRYFDSQELQKAQNYFRRAAQDRAASAEYRARSQYYVAICDFKREDWELALKEFDRLISAHPNSVWVAEAIYHKGLCWQKLGLRLSAQKCFREITRRFPETRWAVYARQELNQPPGGKNRQEWSDIPPSLGRLW